MSAHQHCRDYFKRLSELLDGEIDAADAARIKTHLDACPECRVCWATFQKSVEIFKNIGSEPLPEAVRRELKECIRKALD